MKCNSLYIHIPFCRSICSYCDFKKVILTRKIEDNYFPILFSQLNDIKNKTFKTIYIGGGTPSCIDKDYLESLLFYLSNKLDKKYEFSIECNVEDIDDNFLTLLNKYKVNRLSIGIQTFNEKFIKLCNRHHTKEMAIEKVNLASKYIENISIDMIYGLPFQTFEELKEDVNIAISLPVKHISYYSLLVEPNTLFYTKKYENMDDNLQAKYYEYIYKTLARNGFKRYEISNFSKPNCQSLHNKVYWNANHYYGVGLNASGYINNIRYTNNDNIYKFDKTIKDKQELTKDDLAFEMIMLNLRLDRGMSINKYNKRFNENFLEKYKDKVSNLINKDLIVIKNNHIKTTFKGSLLLNVVLEEFM